MSLETCGLASAPNLGLGEARACEHGRYVKPSRLVLVLGLVAALVSSSARASGPGSYQPPYRIDFRPQDQVRARAVVLRRSDLPSGPRWDSGEIRRPSKVELQPPACSGPGSTKSNLVLTGAISSQWEGGAAPFGYGHYIEDRARLFATEAMVVRDTRSLRSPVRVLRCMKKLYRPTAAGGSCTAPCDVTEVERVISLRRLSLPRLASVTFATRAVVQYKAVRKISQTKSVVSRFLNTSYYVVIAQGRTEIVLIAFGRPHEIGQDLVVRLVRILATRATA
jgi:hypothetical protein